MGEVGLLLGFSVHQGDDGAGRWSGVRGFRVTVDGHSDIIT